MSIFLIKNTKILGIWLFSSVILLTRLKAYYISYIRVLISYIINISTANSLRQNGKKSEIDFEDIVSCGTDFLILTELE